MFNRNFLIVLSLMLVTLLSFNAEAQVFSEVNANLHPLWNSEVIWGDYDNDGDLDLFTCGYYTSDTGPLAKLYENQGNDNFAEVATNIPGAGAASPSWVDYDNDGDLDIFLTGNTIVGGDGHHAKLYENDNGTFVEVDPGFTPVRSGASAWGDYDNDGDFDLLHTGDAVFMDETIFITEIYRNEGDGSFTEIGANLPGIGSSAVAWGDYDNDGDQDFIMCGKYDDEAGDHYYITKLYRNDGNEVFTEVQTDIVGVRYSSVDWGDYDSDGDLDVVITGEYGAPDEVRNAFVYRNDGNDVFTDIEAGITPIRQGDASWGDYDNDGDLDIVLNGEEALGSYIGKVYENQGNDTFIETNENIDGRKRSCANWGDYDADGDLDLAVTGGFSSMNAITKIYRNNTATPNSQPDFPTNLTSTVNGDAATLSWDIASDMETPGDGLTYNIRVGTISGGYDVATPMAEAESGYRLIPAIGNANHNTSWEISGLADGMYYWSVQTLDNNFEGSAFATEQTFTIGGTQNATVDGYAYLSGESDHSGIKVLFESLDQPMTDSTYTDATGYYTITVETGNYDITYSKEGYDSVILENQVFSSDITLPDVTLEQTPTIPVLVVDDDGSGWPDWYDYSDVVTYYTDALDAIGVEYDVYETADYQDSPSYGLLASYDAVIWFCGEGYYDGETVNATDETNLGLYLDNGGNLFLSAQDYLWDMYPGDGDFQAGEFPHDYLHLNSVAHDEWYVDATNPNSTTGGDGSVADGMAFELNDVFTTQRDGLFIDNITHDGVDVFLMSEPSGAAACQYESEIYRTVFTTVSFAGLVDGANGTREQLMENILDYFDVIEIVPEVELTMPDMSAENGEEVSIPIYASDVTDMGITSMNFTLTFADDILEAIDVDNVGTLTEDFAFTTTIDSDQIQVSGSGDTPLAGEGVLVYITFNVIGAEDQTTALEFSEFTFNDGTPIAEYNTPLATFTVESSSGIIDGNLAIPERYELVGNYPNPFNPKTTITYSLPEKSDVDILIYDLSGKLIKRWNVDEQVAGYHSVIWNGTGNDGTSVNSGVYLYRLNAGDYSEVKRMILVK